MIKYSILSFMYKYAKVCLNNILESEKNMNSIGYLGPKGTFSEQAAYSYFNDKKNYQFISFSTIQELILSVNQGKVLKGIVPIENSIEGAVNITIDMLTFESELKIQAEVVIPIQHCLIGYKEFSLNHIKEVLSHGQAIAQCRSYLHNKIPMANIVFTDSTAEAVRIIAKSKQPRVAIGTSLAANNYGLSILDSNIQDQKHNKTRFVVIGKETCKKAKKSKTSIVFSTDNKPGELYRILNIFALWDINMTRILSRPSKNKPEGYVFFVELEGHEDEEDLRDALMMIRRKTSFYKSFGSYEIVE